MRTTFALLILLLCAAPTALAGYQPALYYLKDTNLHAAEAGRLNSTAPNATQPTLRPVPLSQLPAAAFETSVGLKHGPRILGPAYVGLWVGPSPIAHGNLTATLLLQNGSTSVPIANASLRLNANASKLPEPTSPFPPNPSDPQGTLAYELSKLAPVVTPPPKLLYLGYLDIATDATSVLKLTFSVTPGDSALPVADGPAATIQLNATLTPSFLYIPWFKPDPLTVAPSASVSERDYVRWTYDEPASYADESPARPKAASHGVPAPEATLLLGVMALGAAFARRSRKN